MADKNKRFVGASYGFYDRYKDERLLWSEWEEIIGIMNNLDTKAREHGKALSTLQKKLDKIANENNRIKEEKEEWKQNCLIANTENNILWNEISIMLEQGAKPSDAFEKYVDNISTKYDKFRQRKLKQAQNDGVIMDG